MPAGSKQLRQLSRRCFARIEQRRRYDDLADPKPALGHADTDLADRQFLGQLVVVGLAHPFGSRWPLPDHDVVIRPQAPAGAEVDWTSLMQTKHPVDAAV